MGEEGKTAAEVPEVNVHIIRGISTGSQVTTRQERKKKKKKHPPEYDITR